MKPEPLMEWCNEGKRRGGGIRLERRIEPRISIRRERKECKHEEQIPGASFFIIFFICYETVMPKKKLRKNMKN